MDYCVLLTNVGTKIEFVNIYNMFFSRFLIDAQRGDADSDACIPPHIFSGKTAALLLHIRQHRVAPHKISGAKQMQTVIGETLAHAARGRVYHL